VQLAQTQRTWVRGGYRGDRPRVRAVLSDLRDVIEREKRRWRAHGDMTRRIDHGRATEVVFVLGANELGRFHVGSPHLQA